MVYCDFSVVGVAVHGVVGGGWRMRCWMAKRANTAFDGIGARPPNQVNLLRYSPFFTKNGPKTRVGSFIVPKKAFLVIF